MQINLIANLAGNNGISIAARRIIRAVQSRLTDCNVYDLAGNAPRTHLMDGTPAMLLRYQDAPAIDVWFHNANEFDLIPSYLLKPNRHSYTVAMWYWEMLEPPIDSARHLAKLDEIWTPTKFVAQSFARQTTLPITVIPPPIPVMTKGSGRRSDFGIPEQAIVYGYIFDPRSIYSRKNPEAIVDAFQLAFDTAANDGAYLVIKASYLRDFTAVRTRLRERVEQVGGLLIDAELTEQDLDRLVSCFDVYCSLHRSEGFGLGILEAMALGIPVITTGWSGNMDFTTRGNSCQVGYRIRPITSQDLECHPNPELLGISDRACWAEPNVVQAARWMRLLFERADCRQAIGERGREWVRTFYSEGIVVEAVMRRLQGVSERLLGR